MLKLKWLWLVAGVLCGTIFSASSEEHTSVKLKVAAVSIEDAQERAQEELAGSRHPSLENARFTAVFRPTCTGGATESSFYQCSARVVGQ